MVFWSVLYAIFLIYGKEDTYSERERERENMLIPLDTYVTKTKKIYSSQNLPICDEQHKKY